MLIRTKSKGSLEKKRIDVAFEVKSVGEDGTFIGYGSVFDVKDFWDDVVVKGAFDESLKSGKKPALLWQHDSDKPIGVYTDIVEDDKGLRVTGKLLIEEVAQAKEAYALLKAGALSGLSIGYIPIDWEYADKGETRLLKKVDLWEISLVTFPANDQARVSDVKGLDDLATIRDVEGWLRDAKGLSHSEAKAVVATTRDVIQREAEEKAATVAMEDLLKTIKGE